MSKGAVWPGALLKFLLFADLQGLGGVPVLGAGNEDRNYERHSQQADECPGHRRQGGTEPFRFGLAAHRDSHVAVVHTNRTLATANRDGIATVRKH